jgi:hypothetical protein
VRCPNALMESPPLNSVVRFGTYEVSLQSGEVRKYGPRFFKLKAKMVGNMMEWQNPINTMAHTGAAPEAKRTTRRHSSEAPANTLSSRGAESFS